MLFQQANLALADVALVMSLFLFRATHGRGQRRAVLAVAVCGVGEVPVLELSRRPRRKFLRIIQYTECWKK
jgi:hypothetical protein